MALRSVQPFHRPTPISVWISGRVYGWFRKTDVEIGMNLSCKVTAMAWCQMDSLEAVHRSIVWKWIQILFDHDMWASPLTRVNHTVIYDLDSQNRTANRTSWTQGRPKLSRSPSGLRFLRWTTHTGDKSRWYNAYVWNYKDRSLTTSSVVDEASSRGLRHIWWKRWNQFEIEEKPARPQWSFAFFVESPCGRNICYPDERLHRRWKVNLITPYIPNEWFREIYHIDPCECGIDRGRLMSSRRIQHVERW